MKKTLLLILAIFATLNSGLKAQSITDHYALLYYVLYVFRRR